MRLAILLLSLWPALAQAGILDREDPAVTEGNEDYGKGDFPGALDAYGRAAGSKPDAVLDYDRAGALLKQGKLDEAEKAYLDALAHGASGDLASRAYANLGHAMAELGRTDDALKSYRRALEMNPGDEKARHDLGFLLAKKQQEEKKKQDQQKQDQQKQDQDKKDQDKKDQEKKDQDKQDQQGKSDDKKQDDKQAESDPKKQDGKDKGDEKQAQNEPGKQDDPKQDPQEKQSQGEKQDQPKQDPAQPAQASAEKPGTPKQMPRSEAERLLDSLREGEKSFQLWRHQKKTRRSDADKDW